jgi:peptidoglycan hydrolase CwlO-like protein
MKNGQGQPLDTSRLGQAKAIQFQREVAEKLVILERQVIGLEKLPEKVQQFDILSKELSKKLENFDKLHKQVNKFDEAVKEINRIDKVLSRLDKAEKAVTTVKDRIKGLSNEISKLKTNIPEPDRLNLLEQKISDLTNLIAE